MLEVAETLWSVGAINISPCRPIQLTAGLLSPVYIDNRMIMSSPIAREVMGKALARVVSQRVGLDNFDAVVGSPMSGIAPATWLDKRLRKGVLLVDHQPNSSEFRLNDPQKLNLQRLLIVEDHVTSGGSIIRLANFLRAHGKTIEWCLAISALNRTKARKKLLEAGVKLFTLTELPELLKVGQAQGLSAFDHAAVMQWLRNPQQWSTRASEQQANLSP